MPSPPPFAAPHVASNPSAMQQPPKKKARGKKDAADNAPIFLRKTYHMIDTCDPAIATWSDDGTMFVVKDPDKFAAEIIPQFFKHNNFSSFVRQLNFYGFRKIKNDPIKINTALDEIESNWWRFRHEKFQRGRPDLLGEIRKASHTETAEKQEVEALKKEVKQLNARIAGMTGDIEKLTSLVHVLMDNQFKQGAAESSAKKRKLQPSHPAAREPPIAPLHVTSLPDPSSISDVDLLIENSQNGENPVYEPGSVAPLKTTGRFDSVGSLNSLDQDFLHDLFANDPLDDDLGLQEMPVPDEASSLNKPIDNSPGKPPSNPELVKKLHDALAILPPAMQELFVERLIATIAHPENFQQQVEAVTALAGAAVAEAKQRVKTEEGTDTQEALDMAVPLAAATLGAFLTQYGAAIDSRRADKNFRPSIVPMEG